MIAVNAESLWPAILAIAAWPAGVVVIVIVVLLLTRGEQQPAVLRAIAELVRAVRGVPEAGLLEAQQIQADQPSAAVSVSWSRGS
ncbi:hypothetical protein K1T35_48090 (plasmid) [Pseudonocardia sp. DSM 110487]|uniref:hypothetical protein n=1 Tax=Pseudonocardia sp. DSM 110487 TaxID=2865833 RepID=UPI001C69F64D|nr:hypothetical protein [Pseudonocardia sp. DSM 110487]QYN41110.1 hypothetical protein K1T35_48090 [Pseudonocardia sp. DSM 110487]